MLYIDPNTLERFSECQAKTKTGLLVLHEDKPYFDKCMCCLSDDGQELRPDGNWYIVWSIHSKNEAECISVCSQRARKTRDVLVSKVQDLINNWRRKISIAARASEDTTNLESQLEDLEDFQQSLCDIPLLAGFPMDFTWPTIPSSWQSTSVSGVSVADYYNEKITNWSKPQE